MSQRMLSSFLLLFFSWMTKWRPGNMNSKAISFMKALWMLTPFDLSQQSTKLQMEKSMVSWSSFKWPNFAYQKQECRKTIVWSFQTVGARMLILQWKWGNYGGNNGTCRVFCGGFGAHLRESLTNEHPHGENYSCRS